MIRIQTFFDEFPDESLDVWTDEPMIRFIRQVAALLSAEVWDLWSLLFAAGNDIVYAVEVSTRAEQTSHHHHRPKLIIQQPAHAASMDNAAMTQLQRDNVELNRQLHEHSDTVLALRRDLAAAQARLSDVTGTFMCLILIAGSQSQKLNFWRQSLP